MANRELFDLDPDYELDDPEETPLRDRKVVTQPYDLVVESLVEQIKNETIFLRPLNDRPNFQRNYVWNNKLASLLVESVLLNVPIPPCYLSQNDDFELDVIDGQQRIYSIYRFIMNQFKLTGLEALKEFNGLRFHELPTKFQRQFKTHTMRCILISNQSHPEIKFDVFERLNTNTSPLNAQELRNCVYRGSLNSMLKQASEYKPWLSILGRKEPDRRLRDEEIVLRFFSFEMRGTDSYRTPQKQWLNETAKLGRKLSENETSDLKRKWETTIDICLIWFSAKECFRRNGSRTINKALFDIITLEASQTTLEQALDKRASVRRTLRALTQNEEFQDLISRAVDHKKRTSRRFEMWRESYREFGE